MTRITLHEGDLTDASVDAIVNAANSALVLGTGVAGAIDAKGGPAVGEACAANGPIEVGEAAITTAGNLPARHVIHAAGMPPGGRVTEDALRRTLHASLALAEANDCRTVALPAIGAGVGGLSLQTCAEISLAEVRRYVEGRGDACQLDEIRFVLFGEPAYRLFEMVNDAAKVEAQMRRLQNR
ncbi:MAG: macro domain-containing protein [Myxococcota bacterium]